jgi:hydrogenase maturation protein HypF
MAMGGELKSTIATIPNDFLYISQYLGQLNNYEVFKRFTSTCDSFVRLFSTRPQTILIDKHPGYHSSLFGKEFAENNEASIYEVQHHKAHLAAVLAENELFNSPEPVMGVVWDGTGYGDDQTIWGGEFFSYQDGRINRVCHFDYFDWLAGDKMAREPRLSLYSLLSGETIAQSKFTANELAIYQRVLNSERLKTSSVGRLLDAAASLLGLCDHNTYEAQAAMLLENLAFGYRIDHCHSYIDQLERPQIPVYHIMQTMHKELTTGIDPQQIAANLFYTLASSVFLMAEKFNLTRIAFSGGVFQNAILVDMLVSLSTNDFKLYFHRNLSPNDENIAFGQLMYYLNCAS